MGGGGGGGFSLARLSQGGESVWSTATAHISRVAIRPEVLFTQYISYFSDDVMKVEFESWNESAKSVCAATKSN